MSKNKILFVSNGLGLGGKERQLFFLLCGLGQNHEMLIVLRHNNIAFDLNRLRNVTVKISPNPGLWRFTVYYYSVLKLYRPAIVHSWESITSLCSVLFKSFFGYKLINGEIRFARKIERLSGEGIITWLNTHSSDVNISNSEAGLRAFSLRKNNKNMVIYNGYDFTLLPDLRDKRSGKSLVVSMIANFHPHKDHLTLITSCISLLKGGYDIICNLVGEGPQKSKIMEMIPEEFMEKFFFWGSLSNIVEVLKVTDVGVLLSKNGHSEGMSNAIMEFMIYGIPVVVTNTGGNPELVKDGFSGFLVPFEDSDFLASVLVKLIEDRTLLASLGKNAQEYSHYHFRLERMIAEYERVYRKLGIA